MGRYTDYHQAYRQAHENADHFKIPFAVFTDTAGANCCERASKAPIGVSCELIYPGERTGKKPACGVADDMLHYGARFARFAKEHNLDVGDLSRLVRAVAVCEYETVMRETNSDGDADEYRHAVKLLTLAAGLNGVEIDWTLGIRPTFRKDGHILMFPFLPEKE